MRLDSRIVNLLGEYKYKNCSNFWNKKNFLNLTCGNLRNCHGHIFKMTWLYQNDFVHKQLETTIPMGSVRELQIPLVSVSIKVYLIFETQKIFWIWLAEPLGIVIVPSSNGLTINRCLYSTSLKWQFPWIASENCKFHWWV